MKVISNAVKTFHPLSPFFEKYDFSEKDRYEIGQIYHLLSEEKQRYIISNFKEIVDKIDKITYDREIEQGILIGSALTNIELAIQKVKQEKGI